MDVLDRTLKEEYSRESMLTSPRTNGADHFVPSHHLALITQPVLGARSRSRKKTTTNFILDSATSTQDQVDSMTNSRRSSYNDSPPLILPINRVRLGLRKESSASFSSLGGYNTISKEKQSK